MKTSIYSIVAFWPIFLAVNVVLTASAAAQDIDWQYDVKSGISKAEAENKLVLLHFSASWCRPCQALEKFVFPNLEVVRSVNENVVPVHIDVDKQQTLVTEYGVTAVPFDVIITPGGRVIAKQKSPLDSNGYRRMMAGLATPVKDLEDQSKVAIAQKLNEFTDQFNFKPPQISQFKDHTPKAPTHQPPAASPQSAQLARRSNMVSNPFFAESKESNSTPQPKAVSNSFTVSLDQELNAPTAVAKKIADAPNDFASGSQSRTNSFAENKVHSFDRKPAMEEIKLERPVIKSEYEEVTGAQQEQAFCDKNKQQGSLAKERDFFATAPKAAPSQPVQATPGPQLTQLMQQKEQKSNSTGFAKNVTPVQVQQDRFFQQPNVSSGQRDTTRVVAPKNTAQALLKPVHDIAQRVAPSSAHANVDANAFATNKPTFGAKVKQLLQPQAPQPQVPRQSILEQGSPLQPQRQPQRGAVDGQPIPNQAVVSNSAVQQKPSLGLKGKCPVTLLQEGKWIAGDSRFGCIHRDRLYIFSSAEKLKIFQGNPDFFSPILAGYDPVVFHQKGQLVEGLAEHGVFMGKAPDQRILLFKDAQTRAMFQAQPTAYMNTVRQAMNGTTRGANAPVIR